MIDVSARVHPGAEIADDVKIGPYAIVGEGVKIGSGTLVESHVVIKGPTTIGCDNRIFSFAVVGEEPQDKKYAGEATRLRIGDRNTIREYCSIHRGTVQGEGETVIGDDNWIMAHVHIAHDCIVGNHTIFANNASLAGHVEVEDFAILGGFTLVHQFCKLGAHSFTAMNTVLSKDLPTYMMASGNPARTRSINTEGLRRRGFTASQLTALRRAYKTLYRSNLSVAAAIDELTSQAGEQNCLLSLAEFLQRSNRGILR